MALGDHDEAINWLQRSYAAKEIVPIAYIKFDPLLDPLRGQPAF
jgi:hypothetical protein